MGAYEPNSSIHLARSPLTGARARLFASNNDQSITIYDVVPPDSFLSGMDLDNDDTLAMPSSNETSADPFPTLELHDKLFNPTGPINHCSTSSDERWLVAVGDSDDVFLYSIRNSGRDFELVRTMDGARACSSFASHKEHTVTLREACAQARDGAASAQTGPATRKSLRLAAKVRLRPLLLPITTSEGEAGAKREWYLCLT